MNMPSFHLLSTSLSYPLSLGQPTQLKRRILHRGLSWISSAEVKEHNEAELKHVLDPPACCNPEENANQRVYGGGA